MTRSLATATLVAAIGLAATPFAANAAAPAGSEKCSALPPRR